MATENDMVLLLLSRAVARIWHRNKDTPLSSIMDKLLTASQKASIKAVSAEMERLYRLPDIELGEAILGYARQAVALYPETLKREGPSRDTYTTAVFYDLAPELAKRLGFENDMTVRPDVSSKTNEQLRDLVSSAIGFAGWPQGESEQWPNDLLIDPWDMLTHSICNGNPLAMAVDRLAPITVYDRSDASCRKINEVSIARGFEPPFLMWKPEMQVYDRNGNFNLPPVPAVIEDEEIPRAMGM